MIPLIYLIQCDISKWFIPCDAFNKLFFICVIPCDAFKLFYSMWYLQTVLFHVIPSNCFIPCAIFNLLYIMWYFQSVLYDTCKKKLFIIIILLRGYSQSQFLSFSETTITVHRYFKMWCIQTVLYHVTPSSWFTPCDTFKLCYAMWYLQIIYTMRYLQTVSKNVISSNCLYHAIPSTNFFLYHVILSICVIPCDAFKLCYAMWYL